MPDEKPTTEIPKPPVWVNEIMVALASMRTEQQEMRDEQQEFRKDVCGHFDKLEGRISTVETKTNSANPSKHDAENEARIAAEIVARQELAKTTSDRIERIEKKTDDQTVMLNSLVDGASKLIANPTLRLFAQGLLMFATAWLAAHSK